MQPTQADELTSFHREYRPALMAFFLRRVRNYAEAEDMTQEVFIRIAAADRAMRQADAYVFQVAANLLRDRSRRDRVRGEYAAGVRVIDGAGVELLDLHRVAAGREALALFRDGLAELPERTRQIYRAMAKLIAKTGGDA